MDEVEIDEMTVTIKVIKVNSRKMTQSVFKQLKERNIIDEKMQLRGKLWGQVNYHLPGQNRYEPNVVWQLGNSLYRCAVKRLHCSAKSALDRRNDYDFDINRELPHNALAEAVKNAFESEVEELQELFDRYKENYEYLINCDHLFIAT